MNNDELHVLQYFDLKGSVEESLNVSRTAPEKFNICAKFHSISCLNNSLIKYQYMFCKHCKFCPIVI